MSASGVRRGDRGRPSRRAPRRRRGLPSAGARRHGHREHHGRRGAGVRAHRGAAGAHRRPRHRRGRPRARPQARGRGPRPRPPRPARASVPPSCSPRSAGWRSPRSRARSRGGRSTHGGAAGRLHREHRRARRGPDGAALSRRLRRSRTAPPRPGTRSCIEALGGEPLLDLGLRLGEGTGAVLALPLLRAACAMLGEMATFESAGVSGPGRMIALAALAAFTFLTRIPLPGAGSGGCRRAGSVGGLVPARRRGGRRRRRAGAGGERTDLAAAGGRRAVAAWPRCC